MIDPLDPTLDEQVDASEDDATEYTFDGSVSITSSSLRVRSNTNVDYRYFGGARWDGFSIPKGSTIIAAHVEIYIYDAGYDDANFDMHLEKAAAPAAFTTTTNDITDRPETTAYTSWVEDSIIAGGAGWFGSDKSLVSALQEVVDLYTVTAIVWIGHPRDDAGKYCYARTWDEGDHSLAPKLHIEYTPPLGRSHGYIIG